MTSDFLLFLVLAVVAVGSALSMLLSKQCSLLSIVFGDQFRHDRSLFLTAGFALSGDGTGNCVCGSHHGLVLICDHAPGS